jgi:hypothetical protein
MVTVPGSVRTVGPRVFKNCDRLNLVIFQDGTESLGDELFSGCRNLVGVWIPASVTSIGKSIFDEDRGAISVTVARGSFAEEYCRKHGLKQKNGN